MNSCGAILFFLAIVETTLTIGKLWRCNYAVNLIVLIVDRDVRWVVGPVESWKIAEDLANFLLFKLLFPVVTNSFSLLTATRGKDHIVDQFGNTFTVYIVEDLADNAL